MNKTIGWVVAVIVVVGGLWYLSSSQTSTTSPEGSTASSTGVTVVSKTDTTNGVFRSSLQGLLKRAGNYRCTFTRLDAGANTDGTVFISGNRMRGDFVTTVAGNTIQSHMLYLADYVYTWSSIAAQGFKSKATSLTAGGAVTGSNANAFDYSQELDYTCKAWGGDAALFEMPKGIVFTST